MRVTIGSDSYELERGWNPESFVINLGSRYLSLDILLKLSEHFGTTSIDVEALSGGGCPTCGPETDIEVTVIGATKNIPV